MSNKKKDSEKFKKTAEKCKTLVNTSKKKK